MKKISVVKNGCFILLKIKPIQILFALLMLFIPFQSYADKDVGNSVKANAFNLNQNQTKQVSGRVTDSSGTTIPGVTVIIKGTTRGTTTNLDGRFSLENVSDNALLVFSFI